MSISPCRIAERGRDLHSGSGHQGMERARHGSFSASTSAIASSWCRAYAPRLSSRARRTRETGFSDMIPRSARNPTKLLSAARNRSVAAAPRSRRLVGFTETATPFGDPGNGQPDRANAPDREQRAYLADVDLQVAAEGLRLFSIGITPERDERLEVAIVGRRRAQDTLLELDQTGLAECLVDLADRERPGRARRE